MKDSVEKRFSEIEELAVGMGLDFFPIVYEEVPREVIWDIASYGGLPTRMSHWSFGRTFLHQKTHGEMGLSKIYELIINNNPSYAFLDDTNTDVMNLMIAAHCIGHSAFFKHNECFARTNRNMVNQAESNAKIIDQYKEKYGTDVVEDWMDVGFSVARHIDPVLGESRKKYPELRHEFHEVEPLPYADLHGDADAPRVVEKVFNDKLPPHPEKDILWFLVNYAKMLPWQREVLSILRSESFYFYPQMGTKIINEGFASFWHAELMLNYDNLSPAEHMEFVKAHSGVICPRRGSINPYHVGFKIFTDIRKRWDKAYKEGVKSDAFMKCRATDLYDGNGSLVDSKLSGIEKVLEVAKQDDDYSFIHNYLTRELCEELQLFTYGPAGNASMEEGDEDDLVIIDRELNSIREAMTAGSRNYGVPPIVIDSVEDNVLSLRHEEKDKAPLDEKYARETLCLLRKAWKGPITLSTRDRFGVPLRIKVGSKGEKRTFEGESQVFNFEI